MPKAWSAKDERQYKHVKDSELKRGRSEDKAEEVAARTVNKQRREEGRTPNVRTQGTGSDELDNIARDRGVRGRSSMTKAELLAAVRRAA
jgi:hypothetical protein